MSARTLFWAHDKKGRRWTVRRMGSGPVLGFVAHNFDGWDGGVCFPANRWPDSSKSVYVYVLDRKFWSVRRAVENAIVVSEDSPNA